MPKRTIELTRQARLLAVAAALALAGAPAAMAQPAPATPAPAPAPAPAAPAAAPAPAAGAAASAPAPAAGDIAQWVKVCNPKQPAMCSVTKDYVSESGPAPLATFSVQTTPDPKKYALGILVPLGFVFPPGIPINVDGDKKSTAQYVICLPESPQSQAVACIARAEVGDDIVGAMKKGSKLELQLTGGDGKVVSLAFSLAGFSKSFDGPDMGEATVAKQREDAAKIFQEKAAERGKQLIQEQQKQKAGGG
jgi:invasion protein IalB